MSLVFLKRLVCGSHSETSSSRDTARSYRLHKKDLETGIPVSLSRASSSSSSSHDESLLSKPEANFTSDFDPVPLTPTHSSARLISDATIGLSDGLTVPFALSAGLSALGTTRVVIYGGIAELIAGAISMGLGGYLAARSEAESYTATLTSTTHLVTHHPTHALYLAHRVFTPYALPPSALSPLLTSLSTSPPFLTSFLMHFHHSLPPPLPSRAYISALTISLAYFLGGLLPLLPYFFVAETDVDSAFRWSVFVMAIALAVFGYVKTAVVTGWMATGDVCAGVRGAAQMVLVGGVAAGCAMGLVRALG